MTCAVDHDGNYNMSKLKNLRRESQSNCDLSHKFSYSIFRFITNQESIVYINLVRTRVDHIQMYIITHFIMRLRFKTAKLDLDL